MGDDEILQLFYHRVEYAISAVEEKYGRLCRSVARGILKDERDVEECVNDTCMRAWNAIPPEKPRSLEAYLVRITRNLALDRYAYHHSQKRETALTEAYEELEACLPLAKDGPEEAAMVGDRLDNDIAPAKRLGMRTVRILQGYGALSRPRDGWDEPDHTVSALLELPSLFPQKGEHA